MRNNHKSKEDIILSSAEKLFTAKGYAKTKISDIAVEAGISERTVYEYFDGKEELLIAIPKKRIVEITKTNEDHLRGLELARVKL
jgi:TetR/AcrR family transcriptional regulator, fatty acid metabolism regulator protein